MTMTVEQLAPQSLQEQDHTNWQDVDQFEKFGIVIYNFNADKCLTKYSNRFHDSIIPLTIGEAVIIVKKFASTWYFGYSTKNRYLKGIFPQNYLRLCRLNEDDPLALKEGVYEPKRSPFVDEITTVLKDWSQQLRSLYLTNYEKLREFQGRFFELVDQRQKLLSGTIPVDELRETKNLIAFKIDAGNKKLGLDAVVRDDYGQPLDLAKVSTLQLFYRHKRLMENISKNSWEPEKKSTTNSTKNQISYQFYVLIRNFICKLNEDVELLLTLYDSKQFVPITENYLVKWPKEGLARNLDQLQNLKVLFTDLGNRDLAREKVHLVCYAIRVGEMGANRDFNYDSSTLSLSATKRFSQTSFGSGGGGGSSSSSSLGQISLKKAQTTGLRRPLGLAVLDISGYIAGKIHSDEDKQICMPFIQCCERDNLDALLRKVLTNKEYLNKLDNKGQGVWLSVKWLNREQQPDESSLLNLTKITKARKMGFADVILPGDVRNDLYVTIVSGEFSKSKNKASEKNIEVQLTVCNSRFETISNSISLGSGSEMLNEFKSTVYYHDDKPHWHETIKIALGIEDFKEAHLKFQFRHRSSNDSKDKQERPFAIAFVRLMRSNGTTLNDGNHDLIVYRIDQKKFPDLLANLNYLQAGLVSERDELLTMGNGSGGANGTLSTMTTVNGNLNNGLQINTKDSFLIRTNVCSTKLTQNVDLLGLLNWRQNFDSDEHSAAFSHQRKQRRRELLKKALGDLFLVDGEEVVKFLQDVLDSLFAVLADDEDFDVDETAIGNDDGDGDDDNDDLLKEIFDCLLFVITWINDRKYQHFQPVVNLYIRNSFSATLAYRKLIKILKHSIDKANSMINENIDKYLLLKTMKSLHYIFKFIVRSRILFSELNDNKDKKEFENQFRELLNSFVIMMSHKTDDVLLIQGACLRYFPSTISDILQIFDARQFSHILIGLIRKLPANRLVKQKMMTVNEIVHSKLFQIPESRLILLPLFTQLVKECLESNDEASCIDRRTYKTRSVAKIAKVLGTSKHSINEHRGFFEELELCVKVLSDIMELLFNDGQINDGQFIVQEISEIMLTDLRTIIQTTIAMDRENIIVGNLVAILIELFRQMKPYHYDQYMQSFATRSELLDFLMEILLVFRDLVNRTVFANDWFDMIMIQNTVILKSLRYFSHTIRDSFFEKFDYQAWNNFFHCAIAFMTQPVLQIELFSRSKRLRVLRKHKDLRQETGSEIRSMWFNLGLHKIQFVPGLIGPFLEMTLIPEPELRRATIPIFFDMMQCEFYSSKTQPESHTKDNAQIKGTFSEFENEIITKLDILVEGGKGDESYRILFEEIMSDLCEKHVTIGESGLKFVTIVSRLLDLLLEYRNCIRNANKDIQMNSTVQLLDFCSEIDQKEMYIRYLNKLCDLHLESENYTEAAYTLLMYSSLLKWSDLVLSPMLASHRYGRCQTHRELKEALYYKIISYFDKGKMWESALNLCQELCCQYQDETFDYKSLSRLHRKMADFYDSIINEIRPEPEYFRVGFYGRGFLPYLQNKVFVYRGKDYERLSDFSSRIVNQFPNAELLTKLTQPDDSVTESFHQYIQVNKVDTIVDEEKSKRFQTKAAIINSRIVQFYRSNDVRKFKYSRPYYRADDDSEKDRNSCSKTHGTTEPAATNEFAQLWLERTVCEIEHPLPGLLQWFAVTKTETFHLSPLCTAIETMQSTNQQLHEQLVQYLNDDDDDCGSGNGNSLPLNPLSMKLNGILDAAVMGGVSKYEDAFFTDSYAERHPNDASLIERLKSLLAEQIPLLEIGVQLHRRRAPKSLLPFQQRLDDCFLELQSRIVAKYGRKSCDLVMMGGGGVGGGTLLLSRNRRRQSISSAFDDLNNERKPTNERRYSNTPLPYMNSTIRSITSTFHFGTSSPKMTRLMSSSSSSSSYVAAASAAPASNRTSTNSATNSLKKLKKKKSLKFTSSSSSTTVALNDRESNQSRTSNSSFTSGFSSSATNSTQWYATDDMFLSGSSSSMTLTDLTTLTSTTTNTNFGTLTSSSNSTSSSNLPVVATVQDKMSNVSLAVLSSTSAANNASTTAISSSSSSGSAGPAKIVELTEELTPKRPLRSEIEKEKRLSRPLSGQYNLSRLSSTTALNSDNSSSNRDSLGTTDSSSLISEDDLIPPPLPLKNRELESSPAAAAASSPSIINENRSFLHSNRNQIRKSLMRSKTIAASTASSTIATSRRVIPIQIDKTSDAICLPSKSSISSGEKSSTNH